MNFVCPMIIVSDIDESVKFYGNVFGLEVITDFGANKTLTGGLVLQTSETYKDFIDGKSIAFGGNSFELYFEDELLDMNLMIEFGGYWFYKKPGVKCVDLMTYFFENPLNGPADMKVRLFTPPADGLNHPESGDSDTAADGDWMYNTYTVFPKMPEIRIEEEPVSIFKKYK